MQELRIAAEARTEAARDRMKVAAFIGWQTLGAFGNSGTFQKHLERVGLAPKERMTAEARQEAIARGYAVLERAREAFRPAA